MPVTNRPPCHGAFPPTTPCISSQPGLPGPGEEQSRHCSSPGGEGTEGLALPSPRWHPAASSGAEDSHQGDGLPGGMVRLVQTLFCVCSPRGWLRDEGVQPGLPARPHLAKRSPRKKINVHFYRGKKKKRQPVDPSSLLRGAGEPAPRLQAQRHPRSSAGCSGTQPSHPWGWCIPKRLQGQPLCHGLHSRHPQCGMGTGQGLLVRPCARECAVSCERFSSVGRLM